MTQSNLPTLAESQGDICYSDEDYDKPYTAQTMETHTKTINGYLCEVEIDTDSEPSTEGHITKGSCSGSMASVFQLGYIDTACGEHQYEIPDRILHRIEDWAYSVGY